LDSIFCDRHKRVSYETPPFSDSLRAIMKDIVSPLADKAKLIQNRLQFGPFFGGNVAIRGESSQELTGGINPDSRENSARDIYGCFCVPPQDKMHEHLDAREDVREFSERQPVGAEALTAFVGLGGWFRPELRHVPPNQVTSGDRPA